MKPGEPKDALELRLARQPLRSAPADLRGEVISAARRALPVAASSEPLSRRSASTARKAFFWEWLFLRFPLASGGLAACWLVAWLGASADRWVNGAVAAKPVIVSPEQVAEARAQRAELFQLAGFDDPAGKVQRRSADSPRLEAPAAPSRPRGDRRRQPGDGFGVVPEANSRSVVWNGLTSTDAWVVTT